MFKIERFLKRALSAVAVVAVSFLSFGAAVFPQAAEAAGCSAGSLIKSTTAAAVYYCGNDGLRYVFPNFNTYNTWYSSFSGVQTLSDSAIADIALGGNITYKPGIRLVKVQSMPKVYAVAQGGVLRWVATEAAATSLYGSNWNQQVDDLPDWAWVDYGVGSSIFSASDYSPSSAASSAIISYNEFTHSSSSSSSSSGGSASVTLSLSPYSTSLSSGQSTTATVVAYDPAGISIVDVYANGAIIQTCSGGGATGLTCSANIYAANYSGYPSISVYGQEKNVNGVSATSSSSSLTIGSANNASVTLSLSPYASSLPQGQSTTVMVNASDVSAGISAVYVYANGAVIQTCNNLNGVSSATCSAAIYGANYSIGSSVSLYATEINRNGVSSSSSTTSLSITDANSSSSSSGTGTVTLSLSPYASSLPQGQSTTVTANAYDPSALATIYIYANGAVAQTCNIGAGNTSYSCSVTLYASNYAASSAVAVYAQANNRNGQTSVSSTTSLTVGSLAASGTGTVTLSLSPYSSNLPQGQSTTVTVLVTDTYGISTINVYANGAIIQSCSGLGGIAAASCSATLYSINYGSGSSIGIYGQEANTAGGISISATANLAVN
jgi:hypothetical protein